MVTTSGSWTTGRIGRAVVTAYVIFVGVSLARDALVTIARTAEPAVSRLLSTVPVAAVFGLVLLTALLAVHLPTFAIARRTGVASRLATCVLGGLLGIVPFGVAIVLFKESADTLPGLVQFWVRLPGEFVGGVLPFVVAGAAFGADVGASNTRE